MDAAFSSKVGNLQETSGGLMRAVQLIRPTYLSPAPLSDPNLTLSYVKPSPLTPRWSPLTRTPPRPAGPIGRPARGVDDEWERSAWVSRGAGDGDRGEGLVLPRLWSPASLLSLRPQPTLTFACSTHNWHEKAQRVQSVP